MAASRENRAAPFPQQARRMEESRLSHPRYLGRLCQKTVLSQAKISSDLVKDKDPRAESVH